jgi:4a-hydroxytetrahydrobiopterin dehydratase
MSNLAERTITPPRTEGPDPLSGDHLKSYLEMLGHDWHIVDEHHLEKEFKFVNFQEALDFTNRVGELAESVDHHPEICLTWGKAKITIWTHSIGGLCEADFIFAARTDMLLE